MDVSISDCGFRQRCLSNNFFNCWKAKAERLCQSAAKTRKSKVQRLSRKGVGQQVRSKQEAPLEVVI